MGRPRPTSDADRYEEERGGLGNCLANLIQAPVLLATGLIVPVFGLVFIVMGGLKMKECTVEPLIPIWLVVQGVIMVAGIGVGGVASRSAKQGKSQSIVTKIVGFILSLLTLAWFIAGNVWVYRAWAQDPDYAHSWFENGCDMALFNVAFYGIIILDALFILSLLVGVVAFVLRGCSTS